MKGKSKAFLNFFVFLICLFIVWYFTARHWRTWDIGMDELLQIKREVEQEQNTILNIFIDAKNTNQTEEMKKQISIVMKNGNKIFSDLNITYYYLN